MSRYSLEPKATGANVKLFYFNFHILEARSLAPRWFVLISIVSGLHWGLPPTKLFVCCNFHDLVCASCGLKFERDITVELSLAGTNNSNIWFRVPVSLALSLYQYVLRPRRGLGQVSPSLEAPRLQALENSEPLSSTHRKRKTVVIKISRYKGLVLGPFLALRFLEIELGLLCSRPLLPTRCWCVTLMRFYIALYRTCKEAPDSTCWWSSFGPLCKGNVFQKGVRKWTPLKTKAVLPEGSSFGPFLTPSLWQICWSVYFKLKLIWPATAAAGILNCTWSRCPFISILDRRSSLGYP